MPLDKSGSKEAWGKNYGTEIHAGKSPDQAAAIAYSVQRKAKDNAEVTTTKGGKGPIGSKVKAPGGDYIHERKATPNKSARYFTLKRGGKLLRMMQKPGESAEVQSVLTKTNAEPGQKTKQYRLIRHHGN